jgi:hypothetical protein
LYITRAIRKTCSIFSFLGTLPMLYLGEINDNQQAAWCKTIEVLQEGQAQPQEMAIFPEDRMAPDLECEIVSIKPSRAAAVPSPAMGRLLAGLSTVGSAV